MAGALKPEYAAILRRVDLDEIPLKDVSNQMGRTANNATVRLHRARTALRRLLEEVCGACTEHGCLSCACAAPGRDPPIGRGLWGEKIAGRL